MRREITSLSQHLEFAAWFLDNAPRGVAIGLKGELGAGKTTFVRLLIEKISVTLQCPAPKVVSPTYVLHTRYPHLKPCIEHYDLYRLDRPDRKALTEIGYYDALEYAQGARGWLFVEWPSRANDFEVLGLASVMEFVLDEKGRWVVLVE